MLSNRPLGGGVLENLLKLQPDASQGVSINPVLPD